MNRERTRAKKIHLDKKRGDNDEDPKKKKKWGEETFEEEKRLVGPVSGGGTVRGRRDRGAMAFRRGRPNGADRYKGGDGMQLSPCGSLTLGCGGGGRGRG